MTKCIRFQEYRNPKSVIDTRLPKLSRPEVEAGRSPAALVAAEVFHPVMRQPRPARRLVELMLRVQEYVMQNRVRVSEFFRVSGPYLLD